jgi:hypothetical protein
MPFWWMKRSRLDGEDMGKMMCATTGQHAEKREDRKATEEGKAYTSRPLAVRTQTARSLKMVFEMSAAFSYVAQRIT